MNSVLEEFQELRKILCVCPCCGDIVRVSDLRLKFKKAGKLTWLDSFEKKELSLSKKEEKFGEMEEKLREVAREKGRKAAQKVFNSAVHPSIKKLGLDPFDLKPILNPIDFIAFDGMNSGSGEVHKILFLYKENPSLSVVRKQLGSAISGKRYSWQVARIDDSGKIEFE